MKIIEPYRVLSLGWGVQSWTLAVMVALGDIEPIAAAVHSDTTHEREQTYTFASKWIPWLEEHGVKVITVKAEDTNPVNKYGGVLIPAYTTSNNGKAGQIKRQCTDNWKRTPLRRWLQENRSGKQVDLLLGISLDEFQRMRTSDVKYIRHVYPLIEMRMTRGNCINYLKQHGLEVPVKSSCVFCPFHKRNDWKEMKRDAGSDWNTAVKVDQELRDARLPGQLFVHSSRLPLPEAVKIPEDDGAIQLTMLDDDGQCSGGYCFL